MPHATVNGVELFFEIRGSGPPLFFIGGTGSDLRHPLSVLNWPLTKNCTVLAYDHRGQGQSEIVDRPLTMSDFAEDAFGLLEHVGWTSCALMGISFGGMVAQELILRHSEKFTRLVLGATSCGGPGGSSRDIEAWFTCTPKERARQFLLETDLRRDAAWQTANHAQFENLIEQMVAVNLASVRDWNQGVRRLLEARQKHDTYDRLPQISVPTLVCGGRFDGIAPPKNLEVLANRIPNAQLELFNGGHAFLAEDRTAMPRITEFLSRVASVS